MTGGKSGESKSKISPLQQYMIEQAKLSGYRYDISWIQMLFIASFYRRQFSADIKVINYKIKTSFARQEGPKSRANKTCTNSILYFNIRGKL